MIKKYAIVKAPSAFLYEDSGEKNGDNTHEVIDEMLSGWAAEILDRKENWVWVRTFYGYEGWMYGGELKEILREELVSRQDKTKFFYISSRNADILSVPAVQGSILETLHQDSIVEKLDTSQDGSWTCVETAGGNRGWTFSSVLCERKYSDGYLLCDDKIQKEKNFFRRAEESRMSSVEEELRKRIVSTAMSYLGTGYRWGGKSPLGIDCSGLAFMSYLEQGIIIFRDARIEPGYPVREIRKEDLKRADLIFFPGHVAIYLGEGRYIHATGYAKTPRVTINSLNSEDEDYREDLAASIIKCGSCW